MNGWMDGDEINEGLDRCINSNAIKQIFYLYKFPHRYSINN
jgi:hypothetical protein